MGKIRAQHIMAPIIASLAITLAFVAIIPAITETPTASTSLNAMGHVTLQVYDPDGTLVHYIQSDNLIADVPKTELFDALFDDATLPAGQKVYKFLALCAGGSVAGFGATTAGNTACSAGSAGAEMSIARLNGFTSGSSTLTIGPTIWKAVLTGTISVPVADNDETFGELALFDEGTLGTGKLFSVADIADVRLFTNQLVRMTYTITMTG